MTSLRCNVCGGLVREPDVCLRCGGRIDQVRLIEPADRRELVGEFLIGIEFAARGGLMTLRRPRLLGLVLIPFLLNLLIAGTLIALVIGHRDLLRPDFDADWVLGTNWLKGPLESATVVFGIVLGIALSIFGTLMISTVVNAPFLEWLSECVESIVFGQGDRTSISLHYVWNTWLVPLFQAAGLAVVQGVIALILLALSLTGVLVPVVFLGGVWLAAITLGDVAIARKRFPVAARFTLVSGNLGFWLGLALPFFLVPILLPFGVAGATLGFVRQRRFSRR